MLAWFKQNIKKENTQPVDKRTERKETLALADPSNSGAKYDEGFKSMGFLSILLLLYSAKLSNPNMKHLCVGFVHRFDNRQTMLLMFLGV
jgi:hypothetical protein